MAKVSWRGEDRGVTFRPPNLRVYVQSVAAGRDGQPQWNQERYAPWLVASRLEWNANGKPSILTLKRQLGLGTNKPTRDRAEEARGDYTPGDRIILREVLPGANPLEDSALERFRGYLGQDEILIQSQQDFEGLSLTAYGPEIRLRGKAVCGQWTKATAADTAEINSALETADRNRSNTILVPALRCVFNEQGRPNASGTTWTLASDGPADASPQCRVFEVPDRVVAAGSGQSVQALHWTAYTALRSLVEYVDDYDVISRATNWRQIEAALEDEAGQPLPAGEVDVEGMDLPGAMRAILSPLGFGFCLEPWAIADADGWPRHRLEVYPLHRKIRPAEGGGLVGVRRPALAPVEDGNVESTDDEWRRAAVGRLHFVRDQHNIANDVQVIGQNKRVQVLLSFSYQEARDLQPYWDTEAHNLDAWDKGGVVDEFGWDGQDGRTAAALESFKDKYHADGSEFHECNHVFRSFVWNEDGALSNVVKDTAGAAILPDLGGYGIGDGVNYVRRPRPIGPTLTFEGTERATWRPAIVQLGIYADLPDSWITLPQDAYALMKDRAGITITVPNLLTWRPYDVDSLDARSDLWDYRRHTYLTMLFNAIHNAPAGPSLCLRVVGSIETDQPVMGLAARRIGSSWPFRSRTIVRTERFRWREVPAGSEHPAVDADGRVADVVDDHGDAESYARRVRDRAEDGVGHGSVTLRGIARDAYRVGDAVPGTSGRNVDLCVDGGEGLHAAIVTCVIWNFEQGANKTELILDTPLLRITP